ncbi:MAG: hypothetical protein ACOC44_02545 [Promethearchaeia archaeon]
MNDTGFILIIVDLLILLVLFFSEIPVTKKLKKTTNPLYIALLIYIISNQIYFLVNIINLFYGSIFGINLAASIGESLTFNNVIFLTILTLQGLFMGFLLDKKRYFSLPFVASFYVGLFLILVDFQLVLRIYGGIIGIVSGSYLILNGKRNKRGLIFALGLYLIINEVGFQFNHDLMQVIIMLISGLILLLGTSGYIDKYFLIDKEEERKIKSTWIARRVQVTED